jgi:D-beta-D-heptose 7-phosphate kinase/D-beta-D-heptose 1-phosphate adenosyltransferase
MSKESVAVVGDFMLDEYIWGEVSRISPEAPVPVVQVREKSFRLGGAANVANNIRQLGVRTYCFGVIGDDGNGRNLKELMEKQGLNVDGLIQNPRHITTLKTRVIARQQQVVRVDHENRKNTDKKSFSAIVKNIESIAKNLSSIIVSDYSKGVVSREITGRLVDVANRHNIFTAVDPKNMDFNVYKGVSLITPNFREAQKATNSDLATRIVLETKARQLIKANRLEALLITMGAKGMALFQKAKKPIYMDTVAREIFDVSGAGDTVISSYVAAISAGATPREAMVIANHAAGIVIREVGTATVTPKELIKEIEKTFL